MAPLDDRVPFGDDARLMSPKTLLRIVPFLLGPLGVVYVYILAKVDRLDLVSKPILEPLAEWLTMIAAAIFLFRVILDKPKSGGRAFHVLMLALAVAFACREFHWDWTTKAVYIAIGGIAIWAWFWRGRVIPWLDAHSGLKIWFIATGCTYILSQVIARRAFRGVLPYESHLHIPMEEVVETVSHLMLIVLALFPARKS